MVVLWEGTAGEMPNRVEREIEEILNKLDGPSGGRAPTRLHRGWRSRVSRRTSRWRSRLPALPAINPGNLMLTGICLILSGLLLRMVSPDLTRWVVILGLVLFFSSFVLSFTRRGPGGANPNETYWRGQRIARSELRGPSWPERLRTWWRRRNRRRW